MMKAPTREQLEALQRLRHDRHLTEYLSACLESYKDALVVEDRKVQLRQAQGSAFSLGELLKHIHS